MMKLAMLKQVQAGKPLVHMVDEIGRQFAGLLLSARHRVLPRRRPGRAGQAGGQAARSPAARSISFGSGSADTISYAGSVRNSTNSSLETRRSSSHAASS